MDQPPFDQLFSSTQQHDIMTFGAYRIAAAIISIARDMEPNPGLAFFKSCLRILDTSTSSSTWSSVRSIGP